MSEIKVMRVKPLEFPANALWYVGQRYHISPEEIVVYVDDKENIMYVNKNVPKKDIAGFIECVEFPDFWVYDDEYGKGIFLDYVFERYGEAAYQALKDSHSWRIDRERERKAKETINKVFPLIEELYNDESKIVCDEFLLRELSLRVSETGRYTPRKLVDFSKMYTLCLGYLIGAGILNIDGALKEGDTKNE